MIKYSKAGDRLCLAERKIFPEDLKSLCNRFKLVHDPSRHPIREVPDQGQKQRKTGMDQIPLRYSCTEY